MAAEVGSMAVTEQIDAIRALGADPLKKLVWPRLVASMLVMPVAGGLRAGARLRRRDVDHRSAVRHPVAFFFRTALSVGDAWPISLSGMLKTPVFGAIIALVGCHFGMTTRGRHGGRREQHHPHRRRDFDRDPDRRFLSHEIRDLALAARLTPNACSAATRAGGAS